MHLLLRNPDLQTEVDIATRGFQNTDVPKRTVRSDVVLTIVNAYRHRHNMPPLVREVHVPDARELISYQGRRFVRSR